MGTNCKKKKSYLMLTHLFNVWIIHNIVKNNTVTAWLQHVCLSESQIFVESTKSTDSTPLSFSLAVSG